MRTPEPPDAHIRAALLGISTQSPSGRHGRVGSLESEDGSHSEEFVVSPATRSRVVLLASYAGVLVLQIPVAWVGERLTGGVGGFLFLLPLLAYRFVECIASGESVGDHQGAIWIMELLLYAGLYTVVALPTHLALQRHARAHGIAVGIVGLAFVVAMAFAWPFSELPM